MNFYNRAIELKNETIKNRRFVHKNAEAGLELPITKKYVKDKLTEYGLEPIECGKGIISVIGKGEPIILLRADMHLLTRFRAQTTPSSLMVRKSQSTKSPMQTTSPGVSSVLM